MPKIPDRTSLSYAIPSAVTPMTQAGDMGAAARGMAKFGAQLSEIGLEEKKREDALDLIKADAAHKKALMETDRQFENDPDYKTYDERFGAAAAGITENSANMIRSPRMREQWLAKAGVTNEGYRQRILDRGQKLDREDKLGQFEDTLDSYRKMYLSPNATDEQRQSTLADMTHSIDLGERSGLITPLTKRKYLEKFHDGAISEDAEIRARTDPEALIQDLDNPANARYAALEPLAKAKIYEYAKRKLQANAADEAVRMEQSLADNEKMVLDTGSPGEDYDPARAKTLLGDKRFERHVIRMKEAETEHLALNDIESLSNEQIYQRLNIIAPKKGDPDYAIRKKVYDKAERVVNGEDGVFRRRMADPAAAADNSPNVSQKLSDYRANPEDPTASQELVRARIDEQKRLGIPEIQISPITNMEARQIISQVNGLDGKALTAQLIKMEEALVTKYGEYASAVSQKAIAIAIKNDDQAKKVSGIISQAFKGMPVSATDIRSLELMNAANKFDKAFTVDAFGQGGQAFGGAAPTPPIHVKDAAEAKALPPGTLFYSNENPPKLYRR